MISIRVYERKRCHLSLLIEAATTESFTLSLHDALPIWRGRSCPDPGRPRHHLQHGPGIWRYRGDVRHRPADHRLPTPDRPRRSEEHTSELQSHVNLVCRLLPEKKNHNQHAPVTTLIEQY